MISFVVPVYNAAAYLEKCVESLQNQRAELEIILVDDGSKDTSGALCDRLAAQDNRIHVIHQANAGQSVARNVGMAAAHGEYIWFIDSDDWLEPDAAEVTRAKADETQADITVMGMIIDYADQNATVVRTQTDTGVYRGSAEIPQAILSIDRQELLAFPTNKLYRRVFLEREQARFPEVKGPVEDILFQMSYIGRAKIIAMVDRSFYHYVQANGASMVHRYFDGLFEMGQEVNAKRRAFYRELGLVSEEAKTVCAMHCVRQLVHSIKNLYRRSTPEIRALRKTVWKQILRDPDIREDVRRCRGQLTEARLVQLSLATHSAALANAFFASLMLARTHMEPLYMRLRRHLFLKELKSR